MYLSFLGLLLLAYNINGEDCSVATNPYDCCSDLTVPSCESSGCALEGSEGCYWNEPELGCYCYKEGLNTTPSPTVPESKQRKASYDYGECECEGKMTELRFFYEGTTSPVTIVIFRNKDKNETVCEFVNVVNGQEIICNILDFVDENDEPFYETFESNTYFEITASSDDAEICGVSTLTSFHTSCLRSILGTFGDGGCSVMFNSGFRDSRALTDPTIDCDGLEKCSCDDPEPACICPSTYAPVCCDDVTYSSQCRAGCNNVDIECPSGECKREPFYVYECESFGEGCDGAPDGVTVDVDCCVDMVTELCGYCDEDPEPDVSESLYDCPSFGEWCGSADPSVVEIGVDCCVNGMEMCDYCGIYNLLITNGSIMLSMDLNVIMFSILLFTFF